MSHCGSRIALWRGLLENPRGLIAIHDVCAFDRDNKVGTEHMKTNLRRIARAGRRAALGLLLFWLLPIAASAAAGAASSAGEEARWRAHAADTSIVRAVAPARRKGTYIARMAVDAPVI